MGYFFKRDKITWGLIFLQFFYILLPYSAYSSQSIKKNYPLTSFENLMPEVVVVEKKTNEELALPDLGSSDSQLKEEDKLDKKVALGVTQFGNILSKENSLDYLVNYAKNIGQGLVNQRVNDLLNQYGKARVSFGIEQKFSGEFLLPLIDKTNSLFFTQWGLRTNQERNIINLGLGYRQYWGDWMYGINTFYDYDYTWGNARLGIGGEAWTDYLKLSANGYFGLTDWHKSKISAMDDYYERPASGFDIRAQAYLPNYPKLGGSIKYEKYFGKGIHIGNGAGKNNLENNPFALTLGINYTPIPLLIFKGEHTAGDRNDTSVGLDIIYNFGLPLLQHVDPNSVDVIRNLVGNRYDFVDRNYDIVMQYYKQKLISISLPKEILGEGNELVIIPVSVHENKYGLKKVNWIFPANFFDNGGFYNHISPTQIEVNLPAYMFNLKNNTPEEYSLSAVAEDNNGNVSETAKTLIRVKRSKNIINSLNITPKKIIPADNIDYFTITALVTNEHNQPLVAQNITFTVDGLKKSNGKSGIILFDEHSSNEDTLQAKTDGQGKAVVKVRSTVSGKGKIIAKMENGNHSNQPIEFSADAKSAKISTFTVKKDNALANNKEKNELYLLVTDRHENLVKNLIVNLTGNNESKIENITTNNIKTNENGELIVYVTNAKSGISQISAAINGDVKKQSIIFLSDTTTARVDRVILTDFNNVKIADGESFFTFNALVTDEQGNLAPEVEVNWQQNKGNLVVLPASSTTNEEGIATIKLQSTKKLVYDVQVSAKVPGKNAILSDKTVSFRGPIATTSRLQVDNQSIAANDRDEVKLTFIAKDSKNNNIESIARYLSFKISDGSGKILSSNSDGITLSQVEEDLNEKGKYNATVKGTKVGKYNVIPYFHDDPILELNQNIELEADVNSAEVKSVNLDGSATELLANGENSFTFKAIVKDRLGHPVSGVDVNWQQDKNDLVILPISSTTNEEGIATIKLQSSKKPVYDVQVSAKVLGRQLILSDKTVSFIGPVADKSSLDIDKLPILANNAEEATLTFSANDKTGTPIENITNHLSFEIKDSSGNVVDTNKISLTDVKNDPQGKGKYSVKIKGSLASKYTIIPKFNDIPIDILKKTVELIADKSTAEVKSLTLDGSDNPKIANNINLFRFKAIVKDNNGNPVEGVVVTGTHDKQNNIVTLENSLTDSQGEAILILKSTNIAVHNIQISAGVENQSPKEKADKKVSFIANYGTARVENVLIKGNNAPKIANGNDKFTFIAVVKDGYGNPVPNVNISWSHDKKSHIPLLNSAPSNTNEMGEAVFDLTSLKAVRDIQVSAKLDEGEEKIAHEKVSFIADSSTAKISSLTTDKSSAIADGRDVITFTVKVTDKNSNPVNNNKVTVSKTGNAKLAELTNNNVITNSQGQATFTLTSITPGQNTVNAINDTDTTGRTITGVFIADKTTARIVQVNALEPTKTVGLHVPIEIIVQDSNSHPVNGSTVTISSNPDARVTFYKANTGTDRLTNNQATTDHNGKLRVYVTSLTAQKIKVMANLVNNPQDKNNTTNIDFSPDITTARITPANFIVVTDNQVANGIEKNKVKVKVVDDKDNPVPHITVKFETDKSTTPKNQDVNTNKMGEAEFDITHTTAESVNITATSINNISEQKAVTFIADKQTAEVKSVSLEGRNISQVANSTNYFVFKAIVKDKSGNLVKHEEVLWFQDKGNLVTLSSDSSITDENGEATITLTSTRNPVDDVQISAHVLRQAPKYTKDKVSFVGPTENNSVFEINPNKILANDTQKATLTFIAKSTKGLPVENITDQLSFEIKNESGNTPEHGNIYLTNLKVDPQEKSKYEAKIKGKLAGKYTIIPKFNDIPIDILKKTVELIADKSTAEVKSLTLDGSDNPKIANNINFFRFKAIVKDNNGNPVEGVVVTGTHDKQNNIVTLENSLTDSQGEAILILKSTNIAVHNIQISAGVENQLPLVHADKKVTFFNEEVTFTGKVSSAMTDASPIPNAMIEIYKENDDSKLEYSVTTDSSGKYRIDEFKKGPVYRVKVEADGFIPREYLIDYRYDHLDFRLSPTLSGNTQKRIVLQWQSNKNELMDLDASLCRINKQTAEKVCVEPMKLHTRTHQESGQVQFTIDKDERPNEHADKFETHNETITLNQLKPGYDYFYIVKSQTTLNENKIPVLNMISSINNPTVAIEENSGTLGSYTAPDNMKYACWIVFKIDGNSGGLEGINKNNDDCGTF